ncbi:hypothetical protein INT43_003263 [Umbelopsis isabellina]|uniref:Metallo-beta-lactamase domain-containing protein n=1 Tax=Mortierella isabellina TaxID=91625 RepID=A0A8H7UCL9_MORIS|nr:hypothetical protein INT43_003263 [Umbelopsis isabellina]
MKVQCLDRQGSPQNCFLLKLRQLTILVNCPLQITSIFPTAQERNEELNDAQSQVTDFAAVLTSYIERRKMLLDDMIDQSASVNEATCIFRIPDLSLVDVHTIDCVLLTTSKHMLGLPFLTEYLGYKGRILATECAIEFASQLMEELILYHGQTTSTAFPQGSSVANPTTHDMLSNDGWRSIYTLRDARSCINKIQAVRFRENITLFSTMRMIPYSSGYALGGANWSLEAGYEKVAILSSTSLSTDVHPAPCDTSILHDARLVIFSDLVNNGQTPDTEQDLMESTAAAKNKLFAYVGRAIRSRHNVIFSISTSGIVFDLIAELRQYLATIGVEIGSEDASQLSLYMASPVADKSLQYSNICGEWMTDQHQDMMYLPEEPLIHGELLAKGGLQVIKSMDSSMIGQTKLREPCIVFTGDYHNSSRGPVKWFLNRWKSSSFNLCVFVEPDSPPLDVIYQSLPKDCEMTVLRLPIDNRLTLTQAQELLRQHCKISKENSAYALFPSTQGPAEWTVHDNMKWRSYECGEVISVDLQHRWERIAVTEKLAKSITLKRYPLEEGKFYAPFSGLLSLHDNHLELTPVTTLRHQEFIALHRERTLLSQPKVKSLVDRLNQHGISSSALNIRMEDTTVIIELPSHLHASISIGQDTTRIEAADEKMRALLRDVVLHDTVEMA